MMLRMATRRQRKPPAESWSTEHRNKLVITGIAALTAMAVAGGLMYDNSRTVDADSQSTSTYTLPENITSGFAKATDFGDQLAEDTNAPKSVTVFGDSTGNEQGEWVYRVVRTIVEKYDRPVTVHDWSIDQNAYVGENTFGADRPNAPVVIWNGSALGKDASYSIDFFPLMAPQPSDLVIISHGHNQTTPEATTQQTTNLVKLVRGAWDTPPAIAITLQNPRIDSSADNQSAKVEAVRGVFSNRADVEVIDVWTRFESAPDLTALLRPDGFQPSDAGATVWAQTVETSLGLTTP